MPRQRGWTPPPACATCQATSSFRVRVTNGAIRGSGFSANAGGTLTGGASAPGRVDATIGGEFLGEGASALSGSGSGTSAGGEVGLIFRGVRDRD